MVLLTYTCVGTIFTFLVDISADITNSKNRFNWVERILCIMLWPITLPMFIFAFVKEYTRKK